MPLVSVVGPLPEPRGLPAPRLAPPGIRHELTFAERRMASHLQLMIKSAERKFLGAEFVATSSENASNPHARIAHTGFDQRAAMITWPQNARSACWQAVRNRRRRRIWDIYSFFDRDAFYRFRLFSRARAELSPARPRFAPRSLDELVPRTKQRQSWRVRRCVPTTQTNRS